MARWMAGVSEADNLHFRTIVTGLKPADCVQYTNQLVKTMGPLSQIYGFADPQGRILCETTTDFLLSFQMAGVSESKMKAAQDFVKNYCPLDIMAIQAAEALPDLFTPMDFNVDLVTFHTGSYKLLFPLLS